MLTDMKKVKYHRWDEEFNSDFEDFMYGILNDYEYESHVLFFSSTGGSLVSMTRIRDLVNSSDPGRILFVFSGLQQSAAAELLFTLDKDKVRFISRYLTLDFHLYGIDIRYTANGNTDPWYKRDMLDVDYELHSGKDFWKSIGLMPELIDDIVSGKEVCITNTESVDLCKANNILEYGKDK